MKILLEMRPALDGHSGIPQETRLLFRGLGQLAGVEVLGLIQSGNLAVEAGIPLEHGELSGSMNAAQQIDRLSRVVISLQQGAASHRLEHFRSKLLKFGGPVVAGLGSLLGRRVPLTGFDPTHFKDFVWRSMFAKSLPVADFDAVTSGQFRIARWPWFFSNLVGAASGAMGYAVYPRIDTSGIDLMIVETPYPGRVRRSTRMVVRYHDAIPLLMPHTIKDRGLSRAIHYNALRRNAADGAWFACVSDATRRDLLSVMPDLEDRSVTIPNMISHHFYEELAPAARVPEIIWSRKNRQSVGGGGVTIAPQDLAEGGFQYLLMVSTLEPRKNHIALLDAWELLRSGGFPRLNLVCVGAGGWNHEMIMQRFSPWLERGGLHLLQDVPTADLRLLYRHAQATICPSLGEGFDFSGVEAMRSGGVVAASDIPVHREVYGEASEYFSPYAPLEMAAVISDLINPKAQFRRAQLRTEGARVAALYLPEVILPKWHNFLRRVNN